MKLLFIPAKSELKAQIPDSQIRKAKAKLQLPKKLGIIATIQFTNSLNNIKKQLEKQGKNVFIARSKSKAQNLELGQILGCNVEAATQIQDKVDAFLYIGTGIFHPLQVALATNKPIFIFNPETKILSKLDHKTIKRAKARQKTQKIKFMSANKLGILASTKPGQQRLKQAQALKNKLEKQNKQVYIFLFNNFQEEQLENWLSIECWINTACPGLSLEQPKLAWIDNLF